MRSIARVGPVERHARSTMELIRSPQTAVHIVTVLEEMPVQETVDAIGELHEVGIPVGGVIVNQVREPHLSTRQLTAARARRLDPSAVRSGLEAAGITATDTIVDQLLDEAAAHADRVRLEQQQRKAVAATGRPTYELPHLADGIDLAALYEFAGALSDQGAA